MEDDKTINETTSTTGDTTQTVTKINNKADKQEKRHQLDQKIVWLLAGILLVLLSFRFILSLFGANADNSFANFIYKTSNPFLSPFFSLFNYHTYLNGTAHFEAYTLVAIVFYTILAWGISKLILIF